LVGREGESTLGSTGQLRELLLGCDLLLANLVSALASVDAKPDDPATNMTLMIRLMSSSTCSPKKGAAHDRSLIACTRNVFESLGQSES
jgi:hypothetical protein